MQLLSLLRKPNEQLFREATGDRPPTPLQSKAVKSGSVEPLFVGNFLLESKLDDHFGTASLARDLPSGTLWVLRRLPKPLQMGRVTRKQFGLADSQRHNRSIDDVAVNQLRHVDGVSYLVREHRPGRTLRGVIADQGALPETSVARLGDWLAEILMKHPEDPGLRLLSPDQILSTPDGRWQLVDLEWNDIMIRFSTRPGLYRLARYSHGLIAESTWQNAIGVSPSQTLFRLLRFAIGDAGTNHSLPDSDEERLKLADLIANLNDATPPDLDAWRKQLRVVGSAGLVDFEHKLPQHGRSEKPRRPISLWNFGRIAWLFSVFAFTLSLSVAAGLWVGNRQATEPVKSLPTESTEPQSPESTTIYSDDAFQIP